MSQFADFPRQANWLFRFVIKAPAVGRRERQRLRSSFVILLVFLNVLGQVPLIHSEIRKLFIGR